MSLVPDEEGVARERLVACAHRLFGWSANLGAVIAIAMGILLIRLEPEVMRQGWLHAKLGAVLVLIVLHATLYRRIVAAEAEPTEATRTQFGVIAALVGVVVLGVLVLSLLKPF